MKYLALSAISKRQFSKTALSHTKDAYKLVIVGGGTGGITTAAKFSKTLSNHSIVIIEPAKYHYYQPGWTVWLSIIDHQLNI
jgi:hypothetical protein